jgi:hypothetical protein
MSKRDHSDSDSDEPDAKRQSVSVLDRAISSLDAETSEADATLADLANQIAEVDERIRKMTEAETNLRKGLSARLSRSRTARDSKREELNWLRAVGSLIDDSDDQETSLMLRSTWKSYNEYAKSARIDLASCVSAVEAAVIVGYVCHMSSRHDYSDDPMYAVVGGTGRDVDEIECYSFGAPVEVTANPTDAERTKLLQLDEESTYADQCRAVRLASIWVNDEDDICAAAREQPWCTKEEYTDGDHHGAVAVNTIRVPVVIVGRRKVA